MAVSGEPPVPWHLAPTGAITCDIGEVASVDICQSVGHQLANKLGETPARTIASGTWEYLPSGCSLQSGGDWTPHYNVHVVGASSPLYQLVCSGSDPMPWHLARAGATTCDYGESASVHVCESVGHQLANKLQGAHFSLKEIGRLITMQRSW
eukprot:TRINITY_DN3112_c2_g1_i13.p1 TRINITY_DN3112_c2_g1~~TRINITY_DN3112_c2_g1_i13.p1  ORF type:complete len:174 (-),score=8.67 TRINITY_DN3112_c2_g1_i13:6-461(-)